MMHRKIEHLVHKLATQDADARQHLQQLHERQDSARRSRDSRDDSARGPVGPPGFRGVPSFKGNEFSGAQSFLVHGLEPPPDLDMASNVSAESVGAPRFR